MDHTAWYTVGEISYWYDLVQTWVEDHSTNIFNLFRDYPFVLQVAIISIIISIILIVFNLLVMRRNSRKHNKAKRVNKKLRKKYEDALKYIFSEESPKKMSRDDVIEELGIKHDDTPGHLLKNELERIEFSRIMYDLKLHVNSSERRNENILIVCDIFGLANFLEKQVNSGSDAEKIECLRIIWALRIPVNVWLSNTLKNTTSNYLHRMLAYASMSTSTNSSLEYFDSEFFGKECCQYDEIQLGYLFQKRRKLHLDIPDLVHWINIHTSTQARCIFIRLMRKFDLKDSCSALDEIFLNTNDNHLIKEIIRTWGFLKYERGVELMLNVFLLQPDDSKIAIMRAIQRIEVYKEPNSLFLDTYNSNSSFAVRREALRCLYNCGDTGKRMVAELEAEAEDKDKNLFSFFHNAITMQELEIDDSDNDEEEYEDNMFSVQ